MRGEVDVKWSISRQAGLCWAFDGRFVFRIQTIAAVNKMMVMMTTTMIIGTIFDRNKAGVAVPVLVPVVPVVLAVVLLSGVVVPVVFLSGVV